MLALLSATGPVGAYMLPAETMQQLPQPWPPAGWSLTLDLPDRQQAQPHVSKPQLRDGYFGQALYRHISGTSDFWTANILIQDRGGPNAAWRAVSAVRCNSRVYVGNRARECSRGDRRYLTKTLHYQVDRFYVTIQVSGPGDTEYPQFDLGGAGGHGAQPMPDRMQRRDGSRGY